MSSNVAEAVIKRDRNVVLIGLVTVIAVTAVFIIFMARQMASPYPNSYGFTLLDKISAICGPVANASALGGPGFLMLFTMWSVMQVAMMSPTAVPMVLMYSKIERHRQPQRNPYFSTGIFFGGYVVVWTIFSAIFALIQMYLHTASLLSPTMATTSVWLGGGILIAAGLFQFSKIKQSCLNHCRSPIGYLMTEWRGGRNGALLMGMKHGVYCVGCCWILMALLFVAGVMNLLWMALITAFVLIEKIAPAGDRFGKVVGIFFVVWGVGMILWSGF